MMHSDVRVLIGRSAGNGGVASFYDGLSPYLPGNVDFIVVHNPRAASLLKKLIAFPKILCHFVCKSNKVSIICLNPSLVKKAYYRDMLLLSIAAMMGKKTIIFFRGWDVDLENRIECSLFKYWLFRLTYGRADTFIVLGSIFETKLRNLGVKAPVYQISTLARGKGCSPGEIKDRAREVDTEIRCLFMSRLVYGKGLDEAVEMYLGIKDRFPGRRVSLTIAGDGPEMERLKQLLSERRITDVDLPGYVNGSAKDQLLKCHHLLIFPTFYVEGLPNVILEAMLYGLVVAATPVGGIPDVVTDGVNGILFDMKARNEAVYRLCRIFEKAGNVSSIGMENHNKASRQFVPDVVAGRFMNIIESVV